MELVARNTMQLSKYGIAVRADVDVGIGRIEGNSLISVEDERPGAGSVIDAVERIGPLQCRHPGLSIESERYLPVTIRRAQGTFEKFFGCSVEGIGAI